MESHAFYMKRCIELASKGGGFVHPNPLVGALLVSDGNIIGEGFHERFGGPHAEVNAIRSVHDPSLLSSATLYVTLEPCCHYGKTPPCADLIIASGIKNVVIGTTDPNPLMNGKGIERLTKAGIKVTTDILGDECRFMNRRFITFQEQKRPYVVLKWAVSSNGVMGDSSATLKVSNDVSRRLVHKWRTEEHGILVGKETALLDDPLLDARLWGKPDPVRIVVDPNLALPEHLNIFRPGSRVIILNTIKEGTKDHMEYLRFSKGSDSVQSLLHALYRSNIVSVLVEGGRNTLDHFLDSNIWDECRVFRSASELAGNIQAPAVTLAPHLTENINGDILSVYYNPSVSYVQ